MGFGLGFGSVLRLWSRPGGTVIFRVMARLKVRVRARVRVMARVRVVDRVMVMVMMNVRVRVRVAVTVPILFRHLTSLCHFYL